MALRYLFALLLLAPLLAACGSTAPAAVAPATPVIQTVEVTRVVEIEITREVVVTATPRPATATPAATRTPAPTRTPTPPPVGGKWQVATDTSSFDDSERVVLSLDGLIALFPGKVPLRARPAFAHSDAVNRHFAHVAIRHYIASRSASSQNRRQRI